MAARKKTKPAPAKPAPNTETETPTAQPEAPRAESKAATRKKPKPRPKQAVRRAKKRARKAAARRPRTARPERAKARHRGRYSAAEKARILAAAEKGGLTALQVQEEFGVRPVTYYSWRKKAKVAKKRAPVEGTRRQRAARTLAGVVRESVQRRLRAMLPGIVKSEIGAYLEKVFRKGR